MHLIAPLSSPALRAGGPVVKAGDYAVFARAQNILTAAEAERARSKTDAAKAFAEAKEQGLAAGRADAAREKAAQHFALVFSALDYMQQLEDRLISMTCAALGAAAKNAPPDEQLAHQLRQALARWHALPDLVVRAAPEQQAMLSERLRVWQKERGEDLPVRLESDPRLSAGECLLSSPLGQVKLSLAGQLALLQKSVADSRGRMLVFAARAPEEKVQRKAQEKADA